MRTIDQAALEGREREALKAAARLSREGFAALQVVLFGSRARGEGDAESDLDLLILTARALDWRERQAPVDALFEIELAHDVMLGPLVVTRDAWQHGPYTVLPIRAEVERDGRQCEPRCGVPIVDGPVGCQTESPLLGSCSQTCNMKRSEYLDLRHRYEPESIKLVIIAESPPASGKYFYNPTGAVSEPLFSALMRQLPFSPLKKGDGLREFQSRGWVLVDATCEQVNKLITSERNRVIERDYPSLLDDLAKLAPGRSAPLVLIKANVCRILERKLVQDEFIVLNGGTVIPFPSTGRQKEFHRQFGAIIERAGI